MACAYVKFVALFDMVHIVVAGYNFDHYCFMFDRGVVDIVVAGYNVDHYCFMLDRGVVHTVAAGDIVANYCLPFDRGGSYCCDWLYCRPLVFHV